MFGFALYTLPKQFRLRCFAVVHETDIGIFKGLIGMVGIDLRTWLGVKQKKPLSRSIGIRRTPQATTPTPNAATQVQSSWIMPDFAFLCTTDAWNIRYGFGRLRHSRPLAATSCHLIANPLFHANNGFTLQAKRIINTKISIRNECSNYFERKVRRDGRQAQPPVRPGK